MQLQDIAEVNIGINLMRLKNQDNEGEEIKLITVKTIENNNLDLNNTEVYHYVFKNFNKDKLILKNNDIIINLHNGNCYLFEQFDNNTYVIYQRFIKLTISEHYQKYIYVIFEQIKSLIKKIVNRNQTTRLIGNRVSIDEILEINLNDKLFNDKNNQYFQTLNELTLLYNQEYNLKNQIINYLEKGYHE